MLLPLLMRRSYGVADRPRYRLLRAFHGHGQRESSDIVLHIPRANVFRFGDSNKASPVFKDLEWTVKEGENWAVIGSGWGGNKTALLQVRNNSPIPLAENLAVPRANL
jgi:ABC-type molybdenum transport system ATPase subunit/photorepair protein PhrA